MLALSVVEEFKNTNLVDCNQVLCGYSVISLPGKAPAGGIKTPHILDEPAALDANHIARGLAGYALRRVGHE